MQKRLFIGIGVGSPRGMEPLPKVCEAVRRIGAYADNNDTYEKSILFLDDEGAVTAEAIKQELTKEVLRERPRIVWYFCGHGAIVNAEEIWFLSEGRYQWNARISVPELHDVLRTYGPKQISLFSDACQTLKRMPGGGAPVIDNDTGNTRPLVDIFRATIEGEPAYATQEDGPLFSKLIGDVLAGETPDEAIDKQYLQANLRIVSSQSLAIYLRRNLPDYAALAGEDQFPEINSNFVFDTNDYLNLGRISGPRPIDFDPEQSSEALESAPLEPDAAGAEFDQNVYFSGAQAYREFVKLANASLTRPPEERLPAIQIATQSEWRQDFWGVARGLIKEHGFADKIVIGTRVSRAGRLPVLHGVRSRPVLQVLADNRGGYAFYVFDTPRGGDGRKRPSLLQSQKLWIPLQSDVGKGLNLVLHLDPGDGPEDGVTALGWQPRDEWFDPNEVVFDPMQAIKGLLNGTIGASMIPYLAADMRLLKHYDPIYGIVAANLYDRIGDVDSIHRMCLFYGKASQKVPFDLALLCDMPLRRVPGSGYAINVPGVEEDPVAKRAELPDYAWEAMEGRDGLLVAGFGPILQTTWARFAARSRGSDSQSHVLPLPRDAFSAAPFTTLRGNKAGHRLQRFFKALYTD